MGRRQVAWVGTGLDISTQVAILKLSGVHLEREEASERAAPGHPWGRLRKVRWGEGAGETMSWKERI